MRQISWPIRRGPERRGGRCGQRRRSGHGSRRQASQHAQGASALPGHRLHRPDRMAEARLPACSHFALGKDADGHNREGFRQGGSRGRGLVRQRGPPQVRADARGGAQRQVHLHQVPRPVAEVREDRPRQARGEREAGTAGGTQVQRVLRQVHARILTAQPLEEQPGHAAARRRHDDGAVQHRDVAAVVDQHGSAGHLRGDQRQSHILGYAFKSEEDFAAARRMEAIIEQLTALAAGSNLNHFRSRMRAEPTKQSKETPAPCPSRSASTSKRRLHFWTRKSRYPWRRARRPWSPVRLLRRLPLHQRRQRASQAAEAAGDRQLPQLQPRPRAGQAVAARDLEGTRRLARRQPRSSLPAHCPRHRQLPDIPAIHLHARARWNRGSASASCKPCRPTCT